MASRADVEASRAALQRIVDMAETDLRGFLATPDGRCMVQGAISGAPAEAESLGRTLAAQLRAEGGEVILAELACQPGGG